MLTTPISDSSYSDDVDHVKKLLQDGHLNEERLYWFLTNIKNTLFIEDLMLDEQNQIREFIQTHILWQDFNVFLSKKDKLEVNLIQNEIALIYPQFAWEIFSKEHSELHLEMLLKHHYTFNQENWNEHLLSFFTHHDLSIVHNPLLFFKCVHNSLENVHPFEQLRGDKLISEIGAVIQTYDYLKQKNNLLSHPDWDTGQVVLFIQKLKQHGTRFTLTEMDATRLVYSISYNDSEVWASLFQGIYDMTENQEIYESASIETFLNTYQKNEGGDFLSYLKSYIEQKQLNQNLDRSNKVSQKIKI